MLNEREIKVLLYLNEYKKESLEKICEKFKISMRSLEYNVDNINYFLLKSKCSPIIKESEHLYLKENIDKLKLEKIINNFLLNKKERALIIKFILFFYGKLNLMKLSRDLEISKTTIKKDLKQIKLEVKNLNYKYQEGYFLNEPLENEDIKKTEVIKKILFGNVQKGRIINYVENYYPKFFTKYSNEIKALIKVISSELSLNMSKEMYEFLYSYILVIINEKKKLSLTPFENFLKNTEEYKIFSNCCEKILTLEDNKVLLITDLIIGIRISKTTLKNWINEEILVNKMINEFFKRTKIDIKEDKILFECLMYHLKPAIYRTKKGIKLNNEVFNELILNKDPILGIVSDIFEIIKNDLDISFPIEEQSLIGYHFKASIERNMYKEIKRVLLVCGLGYGTSKLLEKKLKESFEIDIVDVVSFHEIKNGMNKYEKLNLIISTIDIEEKLEIPVVKINPIFSQEDLEKLSSLGISRKKNKILLSKLMNTIREVKNKSEEEIIELLKNEFKEIVIDDLVKKEIEIENFIYPNSIKILENVKNWEEAITISGKLLQKNNCINDGYIQEMIENVKKFGSYIIIEEKVAIPHGNIYKNVMKNGISVMVVKEKVDFTNDKNANLIIAFCIKDKESHQKILKVLFSIIENKEKILSITNEIKLFDFLRRIKC